MDEDVDVDEGRSEGKRGRGEGGKGGRGEEGKRKQITVNSRPAVPDLIPRAAGRHAVPGYWDHVCMDTIL
jgi:hypothetical protein